MPNELPTHFECIDPILRVQDLSVSLRYYVDVLGFEQADWETDSFTSVSRDGCGIYLCEGAQGPPRDMGLDRSGGRESPSRRMQKAGCHDPSGAKE